MADGRVDAHDPFDMLYFDPSLLDPLPPPASLSSSSSARARPASEGGPPSRRRRVDEVPPPQRRGTIDFASIANLAVPMDELARVQGSVAMQLRDLLNGATEDAVLAGNDAIYHRVAARVMRATEGSRRDGPVFGQHSVPQGPPASTIDCLVLAARFTEELTLWCLSRNIHKDVRSRVSLKTKLILTQLRDLTAAMASSHPPPHADADKRAREIYKAAADAYLRAGGGRGGTPAREWADTGSGGGGTSARKRASSDAGGGGARATGAPSLSDRAAQGASDHLEYIAIANLARARIAELESIISGAFLAPAAASISNTPLYQRLRTSILAASGHRPTRDESGRRTRTNVFGQLILPHEPPREPRALLLLTLQMAEHLLLWDTSARHSDLENILRGILRRLAEYSTEYEHGERDRQTDTAQLLQLYNDAADAYARAGGGVVGGASTRMWRSGT